jgi:drug/metabolite transporter (DMT)-like permease
VVPSSWSVAYRFTIAGATMSVFALVRRERLTLDGSGWGFIVLFGLAQFAANYNFVYLAEQHVTSGLVAVMFALLLVPNAVLARVFLGQHLGRQLLLGSAVAMAGVALLFVHEARRGAGTPSEVLLGVAMALAAVLSASIANVMQASATARRQPMGAMLAAAMLIGAAGNALFAWASDGPPRWDPRPEYWLGLAYLGVVASAVAFTLYFGVIRAIGPARAAYSSVIIPVIAMCFSTLFEGYRWSALALLGALLTLAGLVVALRARRPG